MQDALFSVNLGGRLGRGGVVSADHGHDARVNHAVGHQRRLRRITGIIFDDQLNRAAQQPALVIDLIDQESNGFLEALALVSIVARHRALQTDEDRVTFLGAGERSQRANND